MRATIFMKRKTLGVFLFFCTFMASLSYMNAQEPFVCGTVNDLSPDTVGSYSASTDPASLTNCLPIVVNIYFWGINHPNGTNHFPNRANDVLQGVANLNILYNPYGIYFKYRGFEEVTSPALPNDSNGHYVLESPGKFYALTSWAANEGYKKEDAFNVYAYGWGIGFGGISPGYNVTTSGSSSANLGGVSLPHEIGHNLNLRHTRSSNEHTTRDLGNINFNADVAGDRVVDTAANSGFLINGEYPYIDDNCEYLAGAETDNVGEPYVILPEDVKNVLANAYDCMEDDYVLSIGQGIRAREAIEDDVNGNFAATITTISSLYEPYEGDYYVSGPFNPALHTPLFQPGFNYQFLECECDCDQPSDYSDTSFSYTNNAILTISEFETDFSIITHPNHSAISLDFDVCDANWQNTRKCYNNWNRASIGGSITKFEDDVFNTNVTITPKDSASINNQNLINDLPQGLYKVEKIYEDGASQETVIIKGNN